MGSYSFFLAWEFETKLLDCSYLEQFSSNWVPFLEYESIHNELYIYKALLDYIKYIISLKELLHIGCHANLP